MNTQKNDGGPAFPYREEDGQGGYEQHQGMNLRDYFAAQALVGMLSEGRSNSNAKHWMPEEAYGLADAMLAAREVSK